MQLLQLRKESLKKIQACTSQNFWNCKSGVYNWDDLVSYNSSLRSSHNYMIFIYSWLQYIVSNKQFPKSIYCHVVNDQVTSLRAFIVPVAARNLHTDISPLMDNNRNQTLFDISSRHGYTGIYSECIIAHLKWTFLALSNLVASYYIYVISVLRTHTGSLSRVLMQVVLFMVLFLLFILSFSLVYIKFSMVLHKISVAGLDDNDNYYLICFDWKTAC